MWDRWSHLLQLLTELTSYKVTFKWKDVEQKAFEDIKFIVTCNILLEYLAFNERFDIHKDVIYCQLGAVISNKGIAISFYRGKLMVT